MLFGKNDLAGVFNRYTKKRGGCSIGGIYSAKVRRMVTREYWEFAVRDLFAGAYSLRGDPLNKMGFLQLCMPRSLDLYDCERAIEHGEGLIAACLCAFAHLAHYSIVRCRSLAVPSHLMLLSIVRESAVVGRHHRGRALLVLVWVERQCDVAGPFLAMRWPFFMSKRRRWTWMTNSSRHNTRICRNHSQFVGWTVITFRFKSVRPG